MKAHLIDAHLLVPRSRSSAKVKVAISGSCFSKDGCFGGISVSQTHLVFSVDRFTACSGINLSLAIIVLFKVWGHQYQLEEFISQFCMEKKCELPPFQFVATVAIAIYQLIGYNRESECPKLYKTNLQLLGLLTHSHTMTPFDAPQKQAF